MWIEVLKCDGCGDPGAECDGSREDALQDVQRRGWLFVGERPYLVSHYCPTCRRAVEAGLDLRTALVRPRGTAVNTDDARRD